MTFDRLEQLLRRIQGYLWTEPLEVLIEIAVIWVVVYVILRFLRGTRGARVIKGMAVVLIIGTLAIQILGRQNAFERLNFLYTNFLAFASLMLVIVFQPELRRALVRLGEARFFRQSGLRKARVVEEVLGAVQYLARNKIGALIAIERQVGLQGIVELGTRLDAEVSKELLNTLFWPGSALHDMGVVVRGDRIIAAGVQFPLAEGENIPQELGSRHRAAWGLSQEADALVIVVSEETGAISVAERGELTRGLSPEELRPILIRGLGSVTIAERNETNGSDAGSDSTLSNEGALGSRS
ncbi:diadenylate cyclase CdaA [Phycisphaerales bacterium AB-hyl4]|uniref:Diadenylate cyclase n=1 Tax=Natronomicrosphaera hydrolytica TaxID=3242702 RepID=A0ABV4U8R2_9BACT